jgi:hypothetical protein
VVRGYRYRLDRKLPVRICRLLASYFGTHPLIRRAVLTVNRDSLPFVAYCHPYEFRLERLRWPRGSGILGRTKSTALEMKWNMCRDGMRSKLTRIVREFRFRSFVDVLNASRRCACERGSHSGAGP